MRTGSVRRAADPRAGAGPRRDVRPAPARRGAPGAPACAPLRVDQGHGCRRGETRPASSCVVRDDVRGFFIVPLLWVIAGGMATAAAVGVTGPTLETGSAGDKNGIGGWCPV